MLFDSISSRRRSIIRGIGLLVLGMAGCTRPAVTSSPQDYLVYVGTNVASNQGNTIFLYRLSSTTGALTQVSAQPGGASPTYLTLDGKKRFLYAVNETQTFQGAKSGSVRSFAVDQHTGGLTLLNEQSSAGAAPCYISLDGTGTVALVANYVGGTSSLLPIGADGQLAPPSSVARHTGQGPHKNQEAPHAHCVITDPASAYAFTVDLGTDRVHRYRLNTAQGLLTEMAEPAFLARAGAGPRHLTFHPNGKQAYLINELNSTVTALAYDEAAGQFRELQTLSALPADFAGPNSCADIHVSPNGRFLYASNRGHNSIAVFSIDAASGMLTPVQHVPTQGKTPRNFVLDPTGRLLLVANQNSNNLVSYRVDQQTGRLTPTGQTAEVPSPMFLQVVEDFRK